MGISCAQPCRYSGRVILSVTIGMDGTVQGIRVMKEVGVGLDEKRHRAAEIWPIRMVNPSSTLARLKSFSDWYRVDTIPVERPAEEGG
jgi:hypothetical protein